MTNSNTKLRANIVAGGGYSTDSQQVAPQACYNASASVPSGSQAKVQLNAALSFSKLQSQLNIDVSTAGGFGMFSASAEANYMRSMEEQDYSLSLNYYNYAFNTISIDLAGYGMGILNQNGQNIYNNGQNPYFGIICGDQYISSYDQGAMLIMGLNIELSSSFAKQEFNGAVKSAFGNIFSAATQVSNIASQLHIQGTVLMQAYQMGGEPSQLANILSKDSNGDYYALSCSIQDMANCIKAANGLLNYAQSNFPQQFSFANNTGLTPLGVGFIDYEPIRYLGVTPPPSLVNQTVINDRVALANSLIENQYYEQKFDELLNGYPVAWDLNSNLYMTSQKLYNQAQNNIKTIMGAGNPHAGAIGCFDYPDECIEITSNIQANLVPISASNLAFLDGAKYYYGHNFANFWFDGSSWININSGAEDQIKSFCGNTVFQPLSALNLCVNTQSTGDGHWWFWHLSNGVLQADGVTINTQCSTSHGGGCQSSAILWMRANPFYFTAYNSSNTDSATLLGNEHDGIADFA